MKKLVWLIVLLLLFTGCSKPNDTAGEAAPVNAENPKGYIAEPQIYISTAHQYKTESWTGEQTELQDRSIMLQGDSFFVDMILEGSYDEEKLKEAVKVEGFSGAPEVSVYKLEVKTVLNIRCREIEHNKTYKLIVSKNIEDTEGKTLKADIEKEIRLKPDTTAIYSLYGAVGTYRDLGAVNIIDGLDVGSMNLTPAPKTISVEFSAAVDKQSVEQSIIQGLQDKELKYSFQWNGDKKLLLELKDFRKNEDEIYAISMSNAKDAEGNAIYGSLYFAVGKEHVLGAIDIKSKSDTVLKRFIDKRYMVVQSPSIDRSIVIDDVEVKSVYDIPSDSISEIQADSEYIRGVPGYSFGHSWRDSGNLILLDRSTGDLLSYSVDEGTSQKLFTLPADIDKHLIMDISVSPDGKMLAAAYQKINPGVSYDMNNTDFYIDLFDMNGKLLYKLEKLYKARAIEAFGFIADIQWLDNENIVMEDNISSETKRDYNVIKIDIKTGKKSVIAEHAYKPLVLPGRNLLKVESFDDIGSDKGSIDIIKNGSTIRSFAASTYEYSSFFFADENTMIGNHLDEIVVFHIATGSSEVIGRGYIVGLSKDRSKVYYMTNYKMLYYIP